LCVTAAIIDTVVISRPYLSNGRAIGTIVVRLSLRRRRLLSVADVLWLNGAM